MFATVTSKGNFENGNFAKSQQMTSKHKITKHAEISRFSHDVALITQTVLIDLGFEWSLGNIFYIHTLIYHNF